MSTSPYKKLKTLNHGWVSYINVKALEPHMAYKMNGLIETNHEKYGKGQQAYIESYQGKKFRTQLPGKYLMNLNAEDIKQIKTDTCNGNNPYLIFREVMPDNSYRIDLLEKSVENDRAFKEGKPFPELEKSIEDPNPENVVEEESEDKSNDKSENEVQEKFPDLEPEKEDK